MGAIFAANPQYLMSSTNIIITTILYKTHNEASITCNEISQPLTIFITK